MTYDVTIPDTFAEAYEAGDVTLMSTDAGSSTTLVDSSHNIVGYAGLVETPDASATRDILSTGGSGAMDTTTVVVVCAVVVTVGAGVWYLLHQRKKAKAATSATEDNQPDADAVLDEAQAVIDAELARHHQTIPDP